MRGMFDQRTGPLGNRLASTDPPNILDSNHSSSPTTQQIACRYLSRPDTKNVVPHTSKSNRLPPHLHTSIIQNATHCAPQDVNCHYRFCALLINLMYPTTCWDDCDPYSEDITADLFRLCAAAALATPETAMLIVPGMESAPIVPMPTGIVGESGVERTRARSVTGIVMAVVVLLLTVV